MLGFKGSNKKGAESASALNRAKDVQEPNQ